MEQQDVVTFPCEECGKNVTFPVERCGHVEDCPHCHEYVDVPNHSDRAGPSVAPSKKAKAESRKQPGPEQSTGRLWFEVVAVLSLAVIPDLFAAVAITVGGASGYSSFIEQQLWLVIRTCQVSLPLLLILSLTGEHWARFGIVRFSWLIDVPSGLIIWMCSLVSYIAIMSLVPTSVLNAVPLESSVNWVKPAGLLGVFLLLASSVANGFAEEFVMRGYLLTRLERLLHSTWLAILVTTALFASYHLYQGPSGLIGATTFGLVYGTAYCVQRRLWPICIAHAIENFSVGMFY
jgi:membrane protease YdiL (CAAX protease family)